MAYQPVTLALLSSLPSRTKVRVVGELSSSGRLLSSVTGQAELVGFGPAGQSQPVQKLPQGGLPARNLHGPAEVWGEVLGQGPTRLRVHGLHPLAQCAGGPELEPGGATQPFDGVVRVLRCGDTLLGQGPDERTYRLNWPQAECGTFAVVGWVTGRGPATLQVCSAQPLTH